jgi:hypothetical protein
MEQFKILEHSSATVVILNGTDESWSRLQQSAKVRHQLTTMLKLWFLPKQDEKSCEAKPFTFSAIVQVHRIIIILLNYSYSAYQNKFFHMKDKFIMQPDHLLITIPFYRTCIDDMSRVTDIMAPRKEFKRPFVKK